MEFPCDKCKIIKVNNGNCYEICEECGLVSEYQIWVDKCIEKEYKNKRFLKGKGKNNGNQER